MANELTVTAAVEKLNKSMQRSSLDELVAAKTRRSLLLLDVSGSMVQTIASGKRKIDALREVATSLRETHPVPMVAFGGRQVSVIDTDIPEPAGGTPMHDAITFAKREGATHAVLITDGVPGSQSRTLDAALAFRGPIDVFYIGDGSDEGAHFAQRLATLTGGTCNLTDLGKPKELAGKITLLLGDGQ